MSSAICRTEIDKQKRKVLYNKANSNRKEKRKEEEEEEPKRKQTVDHP